MMPADEQFWKAVRRCRPRQARVLALHYLEPGGLDAVARILGCSPAAADRALRSGRRTLRRRLRLGDVDRQAASRDLESLDPAGQARAGVDEWARAAALSLVEAATIDPPPLTGPVVLHPKATLTGVSILAVAVLVGVAAVGARSLSRRAPGAPGSATEFNQAVSVVRQLGKGNYRAVAAQYRPDSLPRRYPLQIKDQWQHCMAAYGAYKSHGQPSGGENSVIVPVSTTHGKMDVSVNSDQDGHVSLLGCTGAQPLQPVSMSRAEAASKAGDTVALLRDQNYQAVVDTFNPLEQTYIDSGRLQTMWQTFERAYGSSVGQGQPTASDGLNSVDVPVTWTRASSHIIVSFDGNYQINGLAILLADAPPTALYGGTVAPSPTTAADATRIVNALAGGQFGEVVDSLDALGAAMTTASGLEHAWQTTLGPLGKLEHIGAPVLLGAGVNFLDYQLELHFEHGAGNVQVYLDAHNRILQPIIKKGPATGLSGN